MAVDSPHTLNGQCFHLFESTGRGLVCKYCGYTLPLVRIKESEKSKG